MKKYLFMAMCFLTVLILPASANTLNFDFAHKLTLLQHGPKTWDHKIDLPANLQKTGQAIIQRDLTLSGNLVVIQEQMTPQYYFVRVGLMSKKGRGSLHVTLTTGTNTGSTPVPEPPKEISIDSDLPVKLSWFGKAGYHMVSVIDQATGNAVFEKVIIGNGNPEMLVPQIADVSDLKKQIDDALKANDISLVMKLTDKMLKAANEAANAKPVLTGRNTYVLNTGLSETSGLKIGGKYVWAVSAGNAEGKYSPVVSQKFDLRANNGDCCMCKKTGKATCHRCKGKGYLLMAKDGTVIGDLNNIPNPDFNSSWDNNHYDTNIHDVQIKTCGNCRGSGVSTCFFCKGTGTSSVPVIVKH